MGILRFLLAVSVVAHHCGPILGLTFVGGQLAVQAFFIISGFYITLILNEKYTGINNSYWLFISNRFIRLYPIYWVVLILTMMACLVKVVLTHGQDFAIFNNYLSVKFNIFSFLFLILSNLIIFGQDIVMFLGIDPSTGNFFFSNNFRLTNPHLHFFLFVPQAWSLALELTFYIVAPFIVKKSLKVIFATIFISFCVRLYIYNYLNFTNDPWTFRFFPTEILFFLFGSVSYKINLAIKKRPIPFLINVIFLIVAALFTLFYWYLPDSKIDLIPFSVKDIIYLIFILISVPVLFNFLKSNKWDNKIGELSYPIYISHYLVVMCAEAIHISFFKPTWCILIVTIVFSLLLNKFIALPIEKYRQSRLKASN